MVSFSEQLQDKTLINRDNDQTKIAEVPMTASELTNNSSDLNSNVCLWSLVAGQQTLKWLSDGGSTMKTLVTLVRIRSFNKDDESRFI